MNTKLRLRGKPVSLAVLDYGLFEVHAGPRVIGICGYVIRTDAGEVVLIDTGFPAKYAADPAAATAQDGLGRFGRVLSLGAQNMPAAQLALLGLNPADVTLMIQSHTHIDHMGHMAAFTHAPLLIASAERALPHPLYWPDAAPVPWPQAQYHLVEADFELAPGFDVLLCPGHAPGQLAFVVELPKTGAVLLTSDAISRPAEIDEGFAGAWNAAQARHHGTRLMALARAREACVIYGHCPTQWPDLKKAPHLYE